jgi:hypothetical protein
MNSSGLKHDWGIMDQRSHRIPHQYPPGETNDPNSRLNSQKNPSPQPTNNSECHGFQHVSPTMRLLQINVEGLSAAKRELLSGATNYIDVICIQETHVANDAPCMPPQVKWKMTLFPSMATTSMDEQHMCAQTWQMPKWLNHLNSMIQSALEATQSQMYTNHHLSNGLMLHFQTSNTQLSTWATLTATIQPGDMIVKMRMAAGWQNGPPQTTST